MKIAAAKTEREISAALAVRKQVFIMEFVFETRERLTVITPEALNQFQGLIPTARILPANAL